MVVLRGATSQRDLKLDGEQQEGEPVAHQNTGVQTVSEPGIGLISVGWMGRVHSRAYRMLPLVYPELGIRPRLVHAADTAPERRKEARDILGYPTTSADYHAVLDDPKVDVISICAPNFLHAEVATAAAAAGKAIWLEKPAGRSVAETQTIATAVNAAKLGCAVGFNYRGVPAVEHAKQLIADGVIGRVCNVRGAFFADYSADPRAALSWRFIRTLAGSGVLGDLMGHLIDLCHYLIGPITDTCAMTNTVYEQRPKPDGSASSHFALAQGGDMGRVENEDYAGMLIRFGGGAIGAVGTLEASRVTTGRRASYSIEVYGTEGSLHWDFERMNELQLSTERGIHSGFTTVFAGPGFGDFLHFQPGAGTSMGYDDLKVIEAKKFLGAVTGRSTQPYASIQDGLAAARVTAAAETSAAGGSWQSIPPTEGTSAATLSHTQKAVAA